MVLDWDPNFLYGFNVAFTKVTLAVLGHLLATKRWSTLDLSKLPAYIDWAGFIKQVKPAA